MEPAYIVKRRSALLALMHAILALPCLWALRGNHTPFVMGAFVAGMVGNAFACGMNVRNFLKAGESGPP